MSGNPHQASECPKSTNNGDSDTQPPRVENRTYTDAERQALAAFDSEINAKVRLHKAIEASSPEHVFGGHRSTAGGGTSGHSGAGGTEAGTDVETGDSIHGTQASRGATSASGTASTTQGA
ncbi:hypothetical protein IAU59_007100 [Kwoniella sp. CBS 9459]